MTKAAIIVVFMFVVTSSWGWRRLPHVRNSRDACTDNVRRNVGLLRYKNARGCQHHAWIFLLNEASTLVLEITATVANEPILIMRKASANGEYSITNRIETVDSHELRIERPSMYVQLKVPASVQGFFASYKILARPPLNQRTNLCFTHNPMVSTSCSGRTCTFRCNRPQFVPRNKFAQSIQCSSHMTTSHRSMKWQQRVNNLCIPLQELARQCFRADGQPTGECEYTGTDLVNLFDREESLAGHETPDPMPVDEGPRTLPSHDKVPGHRRTFKKLVCMKYARTTRFKYQCNTFPGKFKDMCVYWRHMTPLCHQGGLFS